MLLSSAEAAPVPVVTVFGSINLDVSYRVSELPAAGETVLSTGSTSGLGGKGANQAVAAARAGARVNFVGAVGADAAGLRLVDVLRRSGVQTDNVEIISEIESGGAMIVVDERGQNQIVVSSAANAAVTPTSADVAHAVIEASDVLVVQGELAADATVRAVHTAERAGVRVIVNLAPYFDLVPELACADPLVVNEVEASQVLGVEVDGLESALALAPRLLKSSRSAVVTIGAEGAVLVTTDEVVHIPAPFVDSVTDTTGAGDAFVGVLSAALAGARPLRDAVRSAVAAATLSVQFLGAAERYPDFSEVLAGGVEVQS